MEWLADVWGFAFPGSLGLYLFLHTVTPLRKTQENLRCDKEAGESGQYFRLVLLGSQTWTWSATPEITIEMQSPLASRLTFVPRTCPSAPWTPLGPSLNLSAFSRPTGPCPFFLHMLFPLTGMLFPHLHQENANYFFKRQPGGHYLWKSALGLSCAEVVTPIFLPWKSFSWASVTMVIIESCDFFAWVPKFKVRDYVSFFFSCGIDPEKVLDENLCWMKDGSLELPWAEGEHLAFCPLSICPRGVCQFCIWP